MAGGAALDAVATKGRWSSSRHGVVRHVGTGAAIVAASTVIAQAMVVIVKPVTTLMARCGGWRVVGIVMQELPHIDV
jgi:hypothetical protein